VVSLLAAPAWCAPKKVHVVVLGGARRVHYSKAGDPAGARADEKDLLIRPLIIDGALKEWTTGESHDVTDRSFVVRRMLKLNDSLPAVPGAARKQEWVWQRGPWLLVDRVTGHILALKLPDYDPGVSQVVWFRDSAAYCGLSAAGKTLNAIVWQLAARKPSLKKKIGFWDAEATSGQACGPTEWQREPLKVTFHPTGREPMSFELQPGSAVLVEDGGDDDEPKEKK
jgi:hypothetical protein